MDLTKKLLDLLTQYIEENKKIKEEYNQKRTNQTLYEELLTALKEKTIEEEKIFISILLNTIYGNNIYVDEFCSILSKPNNEEDLKQFILKIEEEYEGTKYNAYNLKRRIDRNYEIVSSAYRARKSISLKTEILNSKNDVFNVKKIINYFGINGVISTKEEILLINEIELFNRKVATKYGSKEEQNYTESLYNEIPNILTIGFQELEEIEVSKERKNTLDNFAKEIINLIKHIEKEQIIELIETYQKYNIDNNEYNYIIIKVLSEYLDELITLYTLLLEKEIYNKRNQRIDAVKDYYTILERYIIIMDYYNNISEYTEEDEEQEEININPAESKRLIYSRSATVITKAKILSDMSNIDAEYYSSIEDLITKFKNGTIGAKKIKTIQQGNKNNGHIELKNDNVRIVLKHVKDNIYNVLGVIIKKDYNDPKAYKNLMNRTTPDISTDKKLEEQLELAKRTEEELTKLVQEKSRKNGR